MKFMITKTVESRVEIDVELPYYFENDLSTSGWSCVSYGKVEEKKSTLIQITYRHERSQYEVSLEDHPAAYYSSYMVDKHRSSKEKFQEAVRDMLEAFTDATGEKE